MGYKNRLMLVLTGLMLLCLCSSAMAASPGTGYRIWDENANLSSTYTWDYNSFSGFYFDLDSGEGSEEMTIYLDGSSRSVDAGDLTYSTKPIETDFEHDDWGSYEVIGFMAERYFAGYIEDNTTFADETLSMMSKGQLAKVLIDDNDENSVFSGSSIILEDGYALNIIEVDLNGDRVFVSLTKDGEELDSGIVSTDDDYIYETDLGDAEDVPVIVVHFNDVFRGSETNAVFVEGIFQISDEYTEVEGDDNFGEMEVTSIGSDKIEMENDDDITLSKGKTIEIMGNIKFMVADDNDLRFAPFVDLSQPGTFELRGTVFDGGDEFEWLPLNFEGFYYNIDEGVGTESLKITYIDDRKIEKGDLVYSTTPEDVGFEHDDWGEFEVIGFLADKYFAGYSGSTDLDVDSVSLLSDGILSKVLIDDDEESSLFSGSALILEEGYALEIEEVDLNGERVLVTLTKNGEELDNGIVAVDDDYIYETDLGDSDDVPIIAVHFNEVFRGTETNAVFVEGIFQISDEYITIEDDGNYGEMEVDLVNSDGIWLENDDDISLSRDDTIEIMENIQFKVADDDDLRFYPLVEVSSAPLESLDVEFPTTMEQDERVEITVSSRGASVSDVRVEVDGILIGKTGNDGSVSYRPEEAGTFTVTAEKEGFASASGEFEVIDPFDETKKVVVEVSPSTVYEGDTITISVIKAIGGDPIEDADVFYDGDSLGETSSDGTLDYRVSEPGIHRIEPKADGFLGAEFNLEVLALEPEFEFTNFALSSPEVGEGKNVTISVNVTNTGTAEGDHDVKLMVNGSVVDSRKVFLDKGEGTTVEFIHAEEIPGMYLVEVEGITATYEVTKSLPSLGLLASMFILISAAFVVRRSRFKR